MSRVRQYQNPAWRTRFGEAGEKPRASVLIPFYNNLPFLKMVFAGLRRQSFRHFEIVLCDDGSNVEITGQLMPWLESDGMPVQYVWHEDLGFRKNRILNLGIRQSCADFLIFIDADCVAHPEFVREYVDHQAPRVALSGRRVELSPEITSMLSEELIQSGWIEDNYWWIALKLLPRKDSNSPKGFYFEKPWLRQLLNRKPRPIVGSSFGGNKVDFEAVNGFDLRYEGVGIGEDSDIDYRLQLSGVKILPLTNIAIQYHLWHTYKDRPSVNEALFKEVISKGQARTPHGLDQL